LVRRLESRRRSSHQPRFSAANVAPGAQDAAEDTIAAEIR